MQGSNKMIEHVARAICYTHIIEESYSAEAAIWAADHEWRNHVRQAHAAITAMQGLQPVVYDTDSGELCAEIRGAPADVWRMLLEAALQDGLLMPVEEG